MTRFVSGLARGFSLLLAVVALWVLPSSASAEFGYLAAWGSTGGADGQFQMGEVRVAVAPDGTILTVDLSGRVQRFAPDGTFLAKFGSKGTGPGQTITPQGIATDTSGNIYVSSFGGSGAGPKIVKYDSTGVLLTEWQLTEAPRGIAWEPPGQLLVAHESRITRYDTTGTAVGGWGTFGSAPGQFDGVMDIAVASDGRIYTIESNNQRVQRFSAQGEPLATYDIADGSAMNFPALDVAADGSFWTSDAYQAKLRHFSATGEIIDRLVATCASTEGGGASGVAVAGDTVFWNASGRILKFGEGASDPTLCRPGSAAPPPTEEPPPPTEQPPPAPPSTPCRSDRDTGVTINNEAQYTNAPDVTLTIPTPSCVTAIRISNDGGFRQAVTVARRGDGKYQWRLASSGSERLPKTIYVRLLGVTEEAQTFTDDIILDQTVPLIGSAELVNRKSAAAVSAGTPIRRIELVARDNASGLTHFRASPSRRSKGIVKRFGERKRKVDTTIRVRSSGKRLFVKVRDAAGNWSRWHKAS